MQVKSTLRISPDKYPFCTGSTEMTACPLESYSPNELFRIVPLLESLQLKVGVSNILSSHSEMKYIVPLRGVEIDVPPDLLTVTEGG